MRGRVLGGQPSTHTIQPINHCTTRHYGTGYILEEHFVTLSVEFAQKGKKDEGKTTVSGKVRVRKRTYEPEAVVMNQYSKCESGRASLGIVAQQMKRMRIWEEIEDRVVIGQKCVHYQPSEKLKVAWVNMLCGSKGLVQINSHVRPEQALWRMFGLKACAEQSTVSRTVAACDQRSVEGMREAMKHILQRHSQAYRHPYGRQVQVLDVDGSGLPTQGHGEGVEWGYCDQLGKVASGRQLGRVLATHYNEILYEQLADGKQQLGVLLHGLVDETEKILDLDQNRRGRTLLRMDSGGGDEADVNWLLRRGYLILLKMAGSQRTAKLARQIPAAAWLSDPRQPHRQLAWLPHGIVYERPTQQVVERWLSPHHRQVHYAVLVTNAPASLLQDLSATADFPLSGDPHLLQLAYAYDLRSGALESCNRADKQTFGLHHPYTHAFHAQQILLLLAQLAHNLLTWVALRLRPHLAHPIGLQRLLRDALSISGRLYFDPQGHLVGLVLNTLHPLARPLVLAFSKEWASLNFPLLLREI